MITGDGYVIGFVGDGEPGGLTDGQAALYMLTLFGLLVVWFLVTDWFEVGRHQRRSRKEDTMPEPIEWSTHILVDAGDDIDEKNAVGVWRNRARAAGCTPAADPKIRISRFEANPELAATPYQQATSLIRVVGLVEP